MEHQIAKIITQQEINGVQFNVAKANQYVLDLKDLKNELYLKIRPFLKKEVIRPYKVEIKKPYLIDGRYSASVLKWYGDDIPDIGGPFSRVEFVEPVLSKRLRLIAQLLRLGWRPEHYTDKGTPKLTVDTGTGREPCPSLLQIDGSIGKDLTLWFRYSHRQSQIQGWLNNPRLEVDGRLPAGGIPCGTNTGRMTHKVVANVPKASVDVVFGYEMRSLFTVRDGYRMVGHDASGLELRMLSHYMNDPEYTEILLNGDIHAYNQELAGLATRDDAKTFIYALNYGAGDTKLGSFVNGTAKDGSILKSRFLKRNKALGDLIEKVQQASERGYLIGLDGRKLMMRRDDRGRIITRKALSTLLQGAGAVVMKVSMCYLDNWVKKYRLDVKKVIDMHDEAQAEVHPDDVDKYSELAVRSIVKAGEYLNLKCPLDAEAKVGYNWAETH